MQIIAWGVAVRPLRPDGIAQAITPPNRRVHTVAPLTMTGETKQADALNSLFDRLPEDTVQCITMVPTPQDLLEGHLEQLSRKAIGDTQASGHTRDDVEQARALLGRKHKLYRGSIRLTTEHQKNQALHNALAYIDQHFRDSIDQKELAKRCGMTAFRFSRLLKEAYGLGFMDYILSKHMDSAKDLLDNSQMLITSIDYEVGFKAPPTSPAPSSNSPVPRPASIARPVALQPLKKCRRPMANCAM